jgi:hypothetical protein
MSTVQYAGRTYDVLAYDGGQASGEVLLQQRLAAPGEGGKICTGIQKLAQRFLLELFTEKGSIPYWSERGTSFMTEAKAGWLRSQEDVQASLARAIVDVTRNLQTEETGNEPDDERFKSATIASVTYEQDHVRVYLELQSQDSSLSYIVPIAIAY